MIQTSKDLNLVERKLKLSNLQETILLSEKIKILKQHLDFFKTEELEDFNNDNGQRMLYEINSFEEKLDFLYNNLLNIQTKSRGIH